MKVVITFKDPDALDSSLADQLPNSPTTFERVRKQCAKWFEYGEYVNIEIDTEKGTATVLKPTPD